MPIPFRAIALGLILTASPAVARQAGAPHLTPEQAVMTAAGSPVGVTGSFQLKVKAAATERGLLYLNSESDYRDPRCLTVVLTPDLQKRLTELHGAAPDTYLLGRTITVKGTARKVRIDFTTNGAPSGKYYFQTHLMLADPYDLTVLPRH